MPTQQLTVSDVAIGPRIPAIGLHLSASMLVVAVGILGVVPGSRLRQAVEPWINMHVLFGVLLCSVAAGRFYWAAKHCPPGQRSDVRDLSRRVSRTLYLLLFLVIGVRQVIGLWAIGYGTFGVEWPAPAPGASNGSGVDPNDDLHAFFLAGVLALFWVRILAYTVWWRSMSRLADRELEPDLRN
jgi:cytochrome b561